MTSLTIEDGVDRSELVYKSLSGGYKIMNGNRVRKLFFREAIKESVVRGHHIYKEVWSSESTETCSR